MNRLRRSALAWRRNDRFRRLRPIFDVTGSLVIADDAILAVGPLRSQIVVSLGGECVIEEAVYVGYGSSISCDHHVRIGARSRLGAFSMIYDSDFHRAGSHDLRAGEADAPPPKTGPVSIGEDVMIGEGVTILRGTTIGDGAIIDPASVLWGSIPAGSRVSGRPEPSSKP